MTVETDGLPDDAGTLKAMLIAERVRNERLLQIIKELQRHRFGRRTETLPKIRVARARRRRAGRGERRGRKRCGQPGRAGESIRQTAHESGINSAQLPRIEMVVDNDDHSCPCCGNALHRISEDTGERLDIVPAQFRVLVVRRPGLLAGRAERGGAGSRAGPISPLFDRSTPVWCGNIRQLKRRPLPTCSQMPTCWPPPNYR